MMEFKGSKTEANLMAIQLARHHTGRDRIVVMDAGRIVDAGTFRELAGRCELFRRLAHLDLREAAA